jgi:hypothetical protein
VSTMLTITCYKISPRSAAYEGKLKKGGGSQAKGVFKRFDLEPPLDDENVW